VLARRPIAFGLSKRVTLLHFDSGTVPALSRSTPLHLTGAAIAVPRGRNVLVAPAGGLAELTVLDFQQRGERQNASHVPSTVNLKLRGKSYDSRRGAMSFSVE